MPVKPSLKAPVGDEDEYTGAFVTQPVSLSGWRRAGSTMVSKPRSTRPRAETPTMSSQTRTQRPQVIHLLVIPDYKGMVVLNFSLGILAFKAFRFNLVFVGIGYQFTFKVILTAAFKTAFAFFNGLKGYNLRPLPGSCRFVLLVRDETITFVFLDAFEVILIDGFPDDKVGFVIGNGFAV